MPRAQIINAHSIKVNSSFSFKVYLGILWCTLCILFCNGCSGLVHRQTGHAGAWTGYDFHTYPHPAKRLTLPRDVMVEVVNSLGLKLLAIHNEHNENNIAISPYGALSILVAIGEGLQGEAVKELQKSARIPNDISIIRIGLRDIHRHLKSYFIPKEGFLAGLTLNHENVTLRPEYEEILRFYGFDIMSFNSGLYPDPLTTEKPLYVTTTQSSGREMTMEITETISTTIDTKIGVTDIEATTLEPTKSTEDTTSISTTVSTEILTSSSSIPTITTSKLTTTLTTIGTTTPINTKTTETLTENSPFSTTIEEKMTSETTKDTSTTEETKSTTLMIEGTTTQASTVSSTILVPITTEEISTTLRMNDSSENTTKVNLNSMEAFYTPQNDATEDGNLDNITEPQSQTEPAITTSNPTTTFTPTLQTTTEQILEETTATESAIIEQNIAEIPVTPQEIIPNVDTKLETTSEITGEGTTEEINTEQIVNTVEIDTEQVVNTEEITTEKETTVETVIAEETTKISTPSDIDTTTLLSFPYPGASTTINVDVNTNENDISTNDGESGVSKRQIRSKNYFLDLNHFKYNNRLRKTRSVLDYLIARYYDNPHDYNYPQNYHLTPYVPQTQPSFMVLGKYREYEVDYMKYDTILPFFYVSYLKAMALSFPLDSPKYYLLLLLPVDVDGIDKLICDLRLNGSLKYIIDGLRYKRVTAVIPSFMLKGYVNLTPTLQKLGIRRVFEPRQADFSLMTILKEIYITNIEQAITVNIRNYVDPDSYEVRREFREEDPVEFRADHPFLYFVMDSELHVALMAGKIINPLNSRIT